MCSMTSPAYTRSNDSAAKGSARQSATSTRAFATPASVRRAISQASRE
jgi:hypothetical protein